jgi:hypothetical protein
MEGEGYGEGFGSPVSDGERKMAASVFGKRRRKEMEGGCFADRWDRLVSGSGADEGRARAKWADGRGLGSAQRDRRRARGRERRNGPPRGKQAEAVAGKKRRAACAGLRREAAREEKKFLSFFFF